MARHGEGWTGTIGVAEHLGSDTFLYVDCGEAGTLTARIVGELGMREGDQVVLNPEPKRIHRFDAAGKSMSHEA